MSPKPVYHLISEEETFERRLKARIESAQEAVIGSAFFTHGAFLALRESLQQALGNGAQVTCLLGRFDFVTEPRAIVGLLKLASQYPRLKVYFDADYGFHYKLACFKSARGPAVIIGSSNLTPKGLASAGEVNLEIAENQSVYSQARAALQARCAIALPADKHLPDYKRLYDQAKKHRQYRQRWHGIGQRKLTRHRTRPAVSPLNGTSFTFCWIGDYEKDEVLKRNVRKEAAQSDELTFSRQWVHVPKSEAKLYKQGEVFAVVDEWGCSLGFAMCVKNVRVLDSRNSREPIIFYRHLRGWKRVFGSKPKLRAKLDELGVRGDPSRIGAKLSARIKSFLGSRR